MVLPEGKTYQRLYLIKKDMDGNITKEDRGGVIFVPLVGNHGFNMLCGDR
jgi:protein-L-isoaspartate(D-aspartate) O-methyltransferase